MEFTVSKRPETPGSDVMQKTECNIQHRSDLLMEEHIKNVKITQDALKATLLQLENAKSTAEVDTYCREVQNLKEKSEQQVMSLQLMHKINIELAHARADLEDALYQGSGDINLARKRVIWLEDRMGALCGKRRLQRQSQVRTLSGPSRKSSILDLPDRGRDYARVKGPGNNLEGIEEGSSREDGVSQILDVREELGLISDRSSLSLVSGQDAEFNLEYSQDSADFVKVNEQLDLEAQYALEPPIEEESGEVSKLSEPADKSESSTDQHTDDQDEKEDVEQDERNLRSATADSEGRGRDEQPSAEDTQASTEEEKLVEEEEDGEDQKDAEKQVDAEKEMDPQAQTFITEVTTATKSKVNIMEPGQDSSLESRELEEQENDVGRDYWESEHHRFEYGEFAEILCELDPLSYHRMGLAVPGSFLEREESDFQDLPWRTRRRGSDIKDIHRIALDKLASKLHNMQDKVFHATMLSVKPNQQETDVPHEPSFLQSFELSSRAASTPMPGLASAKPITVESRSKTEDTIILPRVEERRLGTSCSGRLVYYPKPIPPPEVLPITRTSKDKEFPRFANIFTNLESDMRNPAERIVDQRNLMEETKLVLYHEKPKPRSPGPSRVEQRFRRMLERERTVSTKGSRSTKTSSGKKMKTHFAVAKVMAKLQSGVSGWSKIKPQSHGKEYSGLRWERVKTIIHNNLLSKRAEERTDAAKQLGLLRCGDPMVFYALKERLYQDPEKRVQYEAAKALVLIGCWEEEILQVILKYLVIGNSEIRTDLIKTMSEGKNVQYIDKSLPAFRELVKLLSHFCCNPNPDDTIAMDTAVLLGKMCVADANAKAKLKFAIESTDTHVKARALEILVKQMNCTDQDVVTGIQDLFNSSPVWKYRSLAAKLLISFGPRHPCVQADSEKIYQLLEKKLWDDPSMEVRLAAAKTLTALGMFSRASETIERQLEDPDEHTRSQAVISVGTLGMKNEKLIRLLLEMLELDSSEFVRLMIIRTFATLNLADRRILRSLREREKLDGPLARESKKALKGLESLQQAVTPKSLAKNKTPSAVPKAITT